LALGLTGPLAGLIAGHFGYGAAFLAATLAVATGAALTQGLAGRAHHAANA
jgi:hypothetical protein